MNSEETDPSVETKSNRHCSNCGVTGHYYVTCAQPCKDCNSTQHTYKKCTVYLDMKVVFRKWFDKKSEFCNSMQTTETVTFEGGKAQLKWWKMKGLIIIKTVELLEGFRGKGLFTKFCKEMLSWPKVENVQMESVQERVLFDKLKKIGWKSSCFESDDLYINSPY